MDCFNNSRRRRRRRRRQTLPQYTHNKKYKKMVYEGTIRPQLARQIDCARQTATEQQTAQTQKQDQEIKQISKHCYILQGRGKHMKINNCFCIFSCCLSIQTKFLMIV